MRLWPHENGVHFRVIMAAIDFCTRCIDKCTNMADAFATPSRSVARSYIRCHFLALTWQAMAVIRAHVVCTKGKGTSSSLNKTRLLSLSLSLSRTHTHIVLVYTHDTVYLMDTRCRYVELNAALSYRPLFVAYASFAMIPRRPCTTGAHILYMDIWISATVINAVCILSHQCWCCTIACIPNDRHHHTSKIPSGFCEGSS